MANNVDQGGEWLTIGTKNKRNDRGGQEGTVTGDNNGRYGEVTVETH
jgi:hypothetical protein